MQLRKWFYNTAFLLAFCHFSPSPLLVAAEPFPMPSEIKPQVEFWIKVFTQHSSKEAIIHDEDDLRIVYGVAALTGNDRQNKTRVQDAIHDVKLTLRSIIRKNFYELSAQEIELLEKIPRPRSRKQLEDLIPNIRYQQGISNRFRESLYRSGRYLPMIRKILRQYQVPMDLAYLPHIESAFNPAATSKSGAAGIWQFTYSTGKSFLNISHTVDERRDPELSTHAAAKLLSQNYQSLKSWPLAITAYNHGTQGVKHLVSTFGSNRIEDILKHKGGSFRFASRNFYPSFLAARYIASNSKAFYPDLVMAPALENELKITRHSIPKPTTSEPTLSGPESIPESLEGGLNAQPRFPSHSQTIVQKYGFTFLKPKTVPNQPQIRLIKSLPGETLDKLCEWADMKLQDLMALNPGLSSGQMGLGLSIWIPATHAGKLHQARSGYYAALAERYLSENQLTLLKPFTIQNLTPVTDMLPKLPDVPVWLLLMFNPKLLSLATLPKGEVVYAPMIESAPITSATPNF